MYVILFMVLIMKRKEIILGVVGIILIVVGAFFAGNMIHDSNLESLNANEEGQQGENDKEEEKFEVDGVAINFKTYRVDQVFFINVPDTFTMLDEATLKEKYNYNSRPELVFMSSDDSEHIYISTTDEDMTDEGLADYVSNRALSLTGFTVLDSGVYEKHGKTFARLVVTDANTYYNFRYFTIDNKLVSVEFNTPVSVYESWEKVIDEVMDSICFNEEDIKKYSSD